MASKRPSGTPKQKQEKRVRCYVPEGEAEYLVGNGLRKVVPYWHTYKTFTKGRWIGKPISECLREEFAQFSPEYYIRAVKTGRVLIDGECVDPSWIVETGKCMEHRVHRHEPPVTAEFPSIIADTGDFLVVNKPASIPMHPSGRYRHNTLLYILANADKKHSYRELRTIHRLDRLTSGIVLLGKHAKAAQQMTKAMGAQRLRKVYLARVDGVFPAKTVDVNEPLHVVDRRFGVVHVDKERGKSARTVFDRLSTTGTTSLVQCRIDSGRMHQIRCHLRWLGFPIVNDPLYGKGGRIDRGKAQRLEVHPKVVSDPTPPWYDEGCPECNGEMMVPRDPTPQEMEMWLHSLSYSCVDEDGSTIWSFEAPLPWWAKDDFKDT